MPPTSDGEIRTVGCSLERLIPDAEHLEKIRAAIAATHTATILASELLNMHLRKTLAADPTTDMSCFFNSNWLLNAYNEVTVGKRKVKTVPELRATRDRYMPPFEPPDRSGTTQCLLYECRNLAAVAATNVWMHFQKRVLRHVRSAFALMEEEYKALTTEARRRRKLELMQVAADVCKHPSSTPTAPASYQEWIRKERNRLGIDAAVGEWGDKPLLYHLKTRPHRFLRCMVQMSTEQEATGGRAFALYPLRHSYVPRHVRFDQLAIRYVLGVGQSDYIKERQKQRLKRKREEDEGKDELRLPPLQACNGDTGVQVEELPTAPTMERKRRTKEEMEEENRQLFASVVDLRAAGVHRRRCFDFAFTTDGVGARVQMRYAAKKSSASASLTTLPSRGIWAIDQLKHLGRTEDVHVVGIDPGKRELVVCVDADDPKRAPVRYTQKERLKDLRSVQYAYEAKRGKPEAVKEAEASLSGYNSRSADLSTFCAYCSKRHEGLEACLAFYSDIGHRRRRWKTVIKTQRSEEKLYKRLEGIKKDNRPLVLAYGSWGMVAGRPGAACNRGNAPCIGVGLMRKLSKRFVVAPTPEAYTSKTCCRCLSACGPWAGVEEKMGKKIRGLRRCTQRDCMLPLNRDKNGATNIATNFLRLIRDEAPIRSMTDEDVAFHRASLCLECD